MIWNIPANLDYLCPFDNTHTHHSSILPSSVNYPRSLLDMAPVAEQFVS
jgi:hypothetical protein